MRILFVSEHYIPKLGGVEVVTHERARRLVRQGHEVHVVTCRLPKTTHYQELDGVKIHRVSLPQVGDRYLFNSLGALPAILRIGRGCDIIHAACYNSAFPAWIGAKILRKKCVVTVYEPLGGLWTSLSGMDYFSAKLHQAAERVLVALPFDKHICGSRYARNCLRLFGVGDDKLTVIYDGIDDELLNLNRADGSEIRDKLGIGDAFTYMYFGRPGISKGVEYLVAAVPQISVAIPDSKLLLILAREPADRYRAITNMCRDEDTNGSVILLDPVPREELANYIAAADCVVVPSLSEGFGHSAAEACALGKPVVASDVASLPEAVSGRSTLVKPRSPTAIAESVVRVYRGEVMDTGAKDYNWDECVQDYLNVYDELVAETGRT